MSNIGPPNWWLRDKMIELTDKTLDVINRTEEKLNTKIDNISDTQYITNNTYNTYNNMRDIIDNGTTNSLRANIVSTTSLRAKTERQSINVTTIHGDNDNIYNISVNKIHPNKLIVNCQKNNNGILVNSHTGLNDIFTGIISFTNSSNIVNKYSLHISQTGINPILPDQKLENILTIIGDNNSSTITEWVNSPEGFYTFTLDNQIVDNPYFDDTNNPSTIILNGTLVFTELVGSIPLVIGNTDEKSIEIKSLHTKLEGNLLDIENNFTNISGNTLNISSNALSINSMNTNIQGQDINIGTNNTHNLIIGNQNNNTTMYNILSGNLNTNLLQTNDITVRNISIPVAWKNISINEKLQVRIRNNNILQLQYYEMNVGIVHGDSAEMLSKKLETFIQENYSYLGSNFIEQNLFSLDERENLKNLDKFAIKIRDISNMELYPLSNIISFTNQPSGHSGNIIELELDGNITNGYSTYSSPFQADLYFIIKEEHNTLNINNSNGKISLQATEGAFNFSGNLTINAGKLTEVVREYVDICSNKIILNGNVTGLTLTPDASIEARHHEGPDSYGTITYSGTDKEWIIHPSIRSNNHITVGTNLNVNNSATISNTLFVSNATTLNNSLYVKDATTMEKSLLCNENITGKQGIYTYSGLFMNAIIPSERNNIGSGININGFHWNKTSTITPELVLPVSQKIIDKDYKVWSTEPTYDNTSRLVSIRLNDLILNTWDTYHIITRENTGRFDFRTIAWNRPLELDGRTIHNNNIKVFHNLRVGHSPNFNPNGNPNTFVGSTWTRRDRCTQISFFSFIETTDGDHKLILNINTVDN